ncbi:MAG: N-formylglutamate amidohydrolase [Rhodobacteraceae bacterium]|nr:N-formylglutamate amidohydrolase [Paracoccaceae bacterium]
MQHPFSLKNPRRATSCALFNAAHSGTGFSADFLGDSVLTKAELRSSEDAFVDQLIDGVVDFGAPLLTANFPRSYIDANRSASELDPAIIQDVKPRMINARVTVGLGVIPRVVADGKNIQRGKISFSDAQARLVACYHPYHAMLKQQIDTQYQRFGMCILFDFHSMPHEAIKTSARIRGRRPQIVLGDCFGKSCDRWITDKVEALFTDAGFVVARNTPFAGGFITQHYGQPRKHIHALQIEIDRSLYMDEVQILRLPDFETFQSRIAKVTADMAALGPNALKIAAE